MVRNGWKVRASEGPSPKEAVGSLIGNKDLESEGNSERRAGEAKEKVGHAKDKVEEVIEKAGHKAEGVIDKAK